MLASALAEAAVCSPKANQAEADKQKQDAETFLQTKVMPALQQALPHNWCKSFVLQAEGDSSKKIGQRIIKYGVDREATMIVMASHSKKPFTKFFLGSVTSYCTHHAKVPLIILH